MTTGRMMEARTLSGGPIVAITQTAKIADYEEAIRRAGGVPRVVGAGDGRPVDVLAGVSGLLLTGGGDVQPALYGEPAHPAFSAAEPGRDEFEIELALRAGDADLPIFAICRGVQVLNVARGGPLVQHIPADVPPGTNHERRETPDAIAHDVVVTAGSLLEALLCARLSADRQCAVNSRHHQAARRPGRGLVATAIAPDGVIEALEDPSRRFCLGVQWHPENFWRTGEFRELFDAFVSACRR